MLSKQLNVMFRVVMLGNISGHRQFVKLLDNLRDWVPLTKQHVIKRVPNSSQEENTVVKAPFRLQMYIVVQTCCLFFELLFNHSSSQIGPSGCEEN